MAVTSRRSPKSMRAWFHPEQVTVEESVARLASTVYFFRYRISSLIVTGPNPIAVANVPSRILNPTITEPQVPR